MAITLNPPAENTDPWYAERAAFDAQVKSTANGAETSAAAANATAGTALDAAGDAQTTANAALPSGDVAGLNDVGWVRGVWLTAVGVVPGGTPANTLVIRSA